MSTPPADRHGTRAGIPVARDPQPATCTEAEPFALRVTDDSMAPEFPRGCVVVVDPTVPPAEGRFFVARTATGLALRRLRAQGDGWCLEALAEGCEPLAVRRADLLGGVTQRAGRRRRELRRYD